MITSWGEPGVCNLSSIAFYSVTFLTWHAGEYLVLLSLLSSLTKSFLVLERDVLLARAEHICIAAAHLGAEALTPADAYATLVVLLDTAVALVVAILSNGDTLQTSHRAFEVCLAAQSVLLGSAWRLGSDNEALIGKLQGFAHGAVDGGDDAATVLEAVLTVFGVAAGLEARVVEETIGVDGVAEGELVVAAGAHELGCEIMSVLER
jgi:hypothetical protein